MSFNLSTACSVALLSFCSRAWSCQKWDWNNYTASYRKSNWCCFGTR